MMHLGVRTSDGRTMVNAFLRTKSLGLPAHSGGKSAHRTPPKSEQKSDTPGLN